MTASFAYLHPYSTDEGTPLVSVIMPAYNTESYIARAIESALEQTVANIEVIVVDDASTDGTVEVVRQFNDSRVRLIACSENQGAAVARNLALQEARGQWIAVLDSDDWYAPERLGAMLEVAQRNAADMIADNIWFIEDGSEVPWSTLVEESGRDISSMQVVTPLMYLENDVHGQKGLHLGLSKPLINRGFLIEHQIFYKPEVRLGQDFFIYLECLIRGAKFVFWPTAYYYYRSRSGSLFTKSQVARLTQACKAMEKWLNEDVVKDSPVLSQALSHNLSAYKNSLAYYSVVEPLKQRPLDFGKVTLAVLQNPYFIVRAAQKLPQFVGPRLRRLLTQKSEDTRRRTA
jgi:succinoglycan biosynthesis protein ExoO